MPRLRVVNVYPPTLGAGLESYDDPEAVRRFVRLAEVPRLRLAQWLSSTAVSSARASYWLMIDQAGMAIRHDELVTSSVDQSLPIRLPEGFADWPVRKAKQRVVDIFVSAIEHVSIANDAGLCSRVWDLLAEEPWEYIHETPRIRLADGNAATFTFRIDQAAMVTVTRRSGSETTPIDRFQLTDTTPRLLTETARALARNKPS